MTARLLLIVTACGIAVPARAQPPPPRDTRPAPVVGTSSIRGVVVSDEKQPRPLRRARVMLNGPALALGRTVIANDDGSFSFDRLPAGRYTAGAAKESYVSMNYGARRTGRPGAGITLADRETKTLTLRLPRGGVVTGTLTDALGQPMAGVQVVAMTYQLFGPTGERRFMPAGLTAGASDDRGVYRIFGLPAGEYRIVTQVRPTIAGGTADLRVLSSAEVRRALNDVRNPTRSQSAQPAEGSLSPRGESTRTVALAPVFYPGTTAAGEATLVTVAAGEERTGIDFQIQHVPTATVSVTLPTPDGTAPPATATLIRTGETLSPPVYRASGSGPLTFHGIPPGTYTVMARGGPAGPPTTWMSHDLVVDGQDIDIALALQPGITIAGRVVFEGSISSPDLSRLKVPPLPALFRGNLGGLPALQFEPDGRFRIPGIIAGPYTMMGNIVRGLRTPIGPWWLKSIVINGRDVLDAPLDLRESTDNAVVTFSDQASELAGVVTDAQGNPLSDRYVIVFSSNKASWFFNSRRVAALRLGADGRYSIRNLPPGDYFCVVFDDIEQGEWFDPAILQKLSEGAARISLSENEKKQHDVKLPGGG
jgi:hypothetical protein